MRKVFDYTLKNADQKISLDEIASVANMTKINENLFGY